MCRCKESTRSSERKLLEILAAEFFEASLFRKHRAWGCGRSVVDTNSSTDDEGFYCAMSVIHKKPRLEVHDSGTTPEDVLKEYFEIKLIP